ncbi:MAG: T9SS type A sorting domain-containing protein, partial [Bacteroidota bacterium]
NFQLQLFSNPVQINSQLTFELPKQEQVEIAVYDAMGKKINSIFTGKLEAGKHQFPIHSNFSVGQYWLVIKTEKAQKTISFLKS